MSDMNDQVSEALEHAAESRFNGIIALLVVA